MKTSYSQFGQDRWVVTLFGGKRNGFFIEVGAGDGIYISNTLLLEKEYGWSGILIEPTSIFEKLVKNRPNCILDNSCIGAEKKKVNLFEVSESAHPVDNLLFSTVRNDIDIQDGQGLTSGLNKFVRAYQKDAIPLQEILQKYKAPKVIDYFSLDVEGSEYEVLRNFPFKEYTFLCLGVERPPKELQRILKNNGYILVAKVFDYMYVNRSLGKFLLLRIIILNIFMKLYNNFKKIIRQIKRLFSIY